MFTPQLLLFSRVSSVNGSNVNGTNPKSCVQSNMMYDCSSIDDTLYKGIPLINKDILTVDLSQIDKLT